jgi:hypothetical protein
MSVARPGDAHRRLVDARAYEAVRAVVKALHGNVPYVLVGGWAVYAYGSTVPSVDTDIFVHRADEATIRRALGDRGVDVGEGRRCELLSMDEPNNILGQDSDFAEPDLGYLPSALLEGRTREIEFSAGGEAMRARVPEPPALVLMKLKAYHDRELAWRALRDPAVMAKLPPGEQTQVRALTVDHYFRKAAKDLFDIAFLVRVTTLQEALMLADAPFAEKLRAAIEQVPRPIQGFAADLAEQDPASTRWLDSRRVIP